MAVFLLWMHEADITIYIFTTYIKFFVNVISHWKQVTSLDKKQIQCKDQLV